MSEQSSMDDQNELFVVVDKNDKIIGHKTRFACHHNKQLIHRGVVVAVFNGKGEILLQKRAKHKDTHPGFYTFSATGHVGKGETYRQAARRELFEEIGIKSKIKLIRKDLMEMSDETEIQSIFFARHEGPFYPNRDEVDEVRFFTIAKVKKIPPKISPFARKTLKDLKLI